MAIKTYTQTLSTFVTSTLDDHRKNVIDQIWTSTDMLAWASAHRKPQVGGKKVFIPVEYGKNTSIKRALSRGSKIELVQDEIITEVWYDWHTYGGGIIRYRDDDLENTGKHAVFNMLEAYLSNLVKAFQETIEIDLFSEESVGTNKFNGLRGLIEDIDSPATASTQVAGSNTVGNLSRATYPWWTNWGRNMTGKDPSVYLTYYMREAVNNVRTWTGRDPEAIITHYVARDMYEDEVGETLRTMNVSLGEIGIRTVEWKGIPFITSPYATQTRMYFIGRDTMELIFEPRMWFKNTPWKDVVQQPFDFARQTVAKGQFIIKKPRGTSVLYNINN